MEHEELLNKFNDLVATYAKHRGYIERARKYADKFSPAVVEKVILDHEVHSSGIAEEVLPLVPQMEEAIAAIAGEADDLNAQKSSSEEKVEELTLRKEIGELTEEQFEQETQKLRSTLDEMNARIEVLEVERKALDEALARWSELAQAAGQADGRKRDEAKGTEAAEPEALDIQVDEPVVEDEVGQHAHVGGYTEDVSAVFEEEPAAAAVKISEDGSAQVIEAAEAEVVEDEPSADVDFGFDEDAREVELSLDEAAIAADSAEEIGIDLGVDGESNGEAKETRRALLLYQEGTADEQIYPFTGEVLTIGRGRDNDIQIKNDSKVSRFHCKLYRRGSNFYIEDNKSSNGTLVNGELITERRLFGGEEVIIGETFFRFRIM